MLSAAKWICGTTLLLLLNLAAVPAWSMNLSACSSMMNDGLYKKYEYRGVDSPMTKSTKKEGSTKGSTVTSTEGSTASVDPKYWMHVTSFWGQYFTSTGPCAMLGLNELYERRDRYYGQNREEILREVSKGTGEHLRVLAQYSLCDEDKIGEFSALLQKRTPALINVDLHVGQVIDAMVIDEPSLKGVCWSYGSVLEVAAQ